MCVSNNNGKAPTGPVEVIHRWSAFGKCLLTGTPTSDTSRIPIALTDYVKQHEPPFEEVYDATHIGEWHISIRLCRWRQI